MATARRGSVVLVLVGLVVYLLTRAKLVTLGVGNADIAGILYNADILNDGGLP